MSQEQYSVKERQSTRIAEPRKYKVVFHNDDFTTVEFVIDVLKSVFHKNTVDATAIMLSVHKKGSGVAGIYSYDIAVSKRDRAIEMARAEGFPLKITVELA